MVNFASNLHNLIERVEKARLSVDSHKIIKIVAVSKYSDSKEIKSVYQEGQRAFGENKVQDLKSKSIELDELPIEWHFIGRLQKNKINQLLELNPFLIHSIDSFELASEIDKRSSNKKISALLQINSSYEDSKSGIDPQKAIDEFYKIRELCPNISLEGVMSIGALSEEREDIIKSFKITKKIFDELKDVKYCSMGMSGDFELAILEGSNLIRVGSTIFK